jgi:hypothetical protein
VLALAVLFSVFIGLVVTGQARSEQVLDLNNSGVWVTSDAKSVFARMNRSAGAVDVVLSDSSQLRSSRLDVLQDQESILGWQPDRGRFFPIDTSSGRVVDGVELIVDPGARISMGGGILAMLNTLGEVRVVAYARNQTLDPSGLQSGRTTRANLQNLAGAVAIAVDSAGTIFAASASGEWALVPKNGPTRSGSVTAIGEVLTSIEVTLVGGIGVIADVLTGEIYTTEGGRHHLGSDTGIVLQQPTATGDRLVVGMRTGLMSLSLRSDGSWATLYSVPDPGAGRLASAPVVLGGYVYGAWSGQPALVVRLAEDGSRIIDDGLGANDGGPRTLIDPVFRVNYGSVILNDLQTGWVFDVDQQVSLSDLELTEDDAPGADDQASSRVDPVTAIDDHIWVRPGQVSVLHVLDNDLNPSGGILVIAAVGAVSVGQVAIAPNGQTLVFTPPLGHFEDIVFSYSASNRSLIGGDSEESSSTAQVTLSMRPPDRNSPPTQLEASDRSAYPVVSGGTVAISPLGNWRDGDCDPLVIVGAADSAGRLVPVTNQSVIQYTAQAGLYSEEVAVTYVVMDPLGATASGEVIVQVLGSSVTHGVPPIANADVVRGVIGQPLTISPLDNDQPGADPTTRDPKLKLSAPVEGRIGLIAQTDLASGVITVTASRSGTYFLDYAITYGSMSDSAVIRVDIVERDSILAMPDAMVLYGRVGSYVDVLANDHDPGGSVLTVVSATPQIADLLRVAIVDGRWVWVQAKTDNPSLAACVIDYVVTDGSGNEAIGQITVTLHQAIANDVVRAVDDYAVVRAGDATLIPVLNNDVATSGQKLVLFPAAADSTLPAGQLKVTNPGGGSTADTDYGQAYVDGDYVRYVAPQHLAATERIRVEYLVGIAGGTPVSGVIWIDVIPQPDQHLVNLPPQPSALEVRCVRGSTIEIYVTPYGQDPDGDSVTVVGLAVPPKYGRIVEIRGNTLIYESYPDAKSPGTDSFQYIVSDRWAATGIGGVRLGVVSPGQISPPLAIDDYYTLRPGVFGFIRPTSNDILPTGGKNPSINLDGDPPGVNLVFDSTGIFPVVKVLRVEVPLVTTQALTFSYHLSAGGQSGPSAQVTIVTQEGYNNPPRVFDTVARDLKDGQAYVPVLADAWDIDGPREDLTIVEVSAGEIDCPDQMDPTTPPGECQVVIPLTDQPQIVSYVVADGDGARASAVIFVPAQTPNRPQLGPSSLINLAVNGTKTINLNDYLSSPRGGGLHLTAASRAWTAPQAHLALTINSDYEITLTAKSDYTGPAALTVEVRDTADWADPSALIGLVTIPVQIGAINPVLFCPPGAIEVVQGGQARPLPIGEFCHVWMPTEEQVSDLTFTGTWSVGKENFLTVQPGQVLNVQATSVAKPGTHGWLTIGVDGYDTTSEIQVVVAGASKPTLQVTSIVDVKPGTLVKVPVNVLSPLTNSTPTIIEASAVGSNVEVRIAKTDLLVVIGPEARGVYTFTVIASDLSDRSRSDRWVKTTFTIKVYARPNAPSTPQPGEQPRPGSLFVHYLPGSDNGAPITNYVVETEGGGTTNCGMSTICEITGLSEQALYRFRVKATNKAGDSDWSGWSRTITLSTAPTSVRNLACSSPIQDSEITLTWDAPTGMYPPTSYRVIAASNTYTVAHPERSLTISALANGQHQFRVVAENDAGLSQTSPFVTCWASGPPIWPSNAEIMVQTQNLGATRQVQISWTPVGLNGPGPIVYTVYRVKQPGTTLELIGSTQDHSIIDQTVLVNGDQYNYVVEAENPAGLVATLTGGPFVVGDSPANWAANSFTIAPTGVSGEVSVEITSFPNWHGVQGWVRTIYNGIDQGTITVDNPSGYVIDQSMNGRPFTIWLQACNPSGCNTAEAVTLSDGPYGPLNLTGLTITSQQPREVCFTVTASGNGRGAALGFDAETDTGQGLVVSYSQFDVPATGSVSAESCATTEPGTALTVSATLTSTNPDREVIATVQTQAPELPQLPTPDLRVERDLDLFNGRAVCAEVALTRLSAGVMARLEIRLDGAMLVNDIYTGTVQLARQCWDAGGHQVAKTFSARLSTLSIDWRDSETSLKPVTSLVAPPPDWASGTVFLTALGNGPQLRFSVSSFPADADYVSLVLAGSQHTVYDTAPVSLSAPYWTTHEATNIIACREDGGVAVCNRPYEDLFGPVAATAWGPLSVGLASSSVEGGTACVVFSYDKAGASAVAAMSNDLDNTSITDTGSQLEQCVSAQSGVDQVTFTIILTDTSPFGRLSAQTSVTLYF